MECDTCPDGQLLSLCCSRPASKKDRCGCFSAADPPAGSVLCRTYDIHLEQCARVLFNFKKTKGHGVLVLWPPLSAVPAKNSDAPLAPRSHCILRFFSSVARRSTARPGHFTSFPSLPIQSLVHWGFVVKPNKCEGILSKVTSRFNDDMGLPKILARVSVMQRLRIPSYEHHDFVEKRN